MNSLCRRTTKQTELMTVYLRTRIIFFTNKSICVSEYQPDWAALHVFVFQYIELLVLCSLNLQRYKVKVEHMGLARIKKNSGATKTYTKAGRHSEGTLTGKLAENNTGIKKKTVEHEHG